jgi:subtilase-type serine protease
MMMVILTTSWVTHIDNYITALNNYQSVGVIVQSNSNTSTEMDADLMAALPEFYSQLEEAWITAINIEVDGAAGSETYTRMSAPCGVTAEYCLGADGYQMYGVAINDSNYYYIGSGTSYAAPQISGAIALLS